MDKLSPFSRVAILGAGNGAHAMAGHLALKGFTVRLYNKFEEEIVQLRDHGGVTVEGAVEGFGRLYDFFHYVIINLPIRIIFRRCIYSIQV